MKKIILFFLLFLITDFSNAQWVQISTSLNIHEFARSGNNIIASSATGIYLSSNIGTNWNLVGLSNTPINSLETTENYVFAGVFSSGIYLSTNNGLNWPTVPQNPMSLSRLAINQNYLYSSSSMVGGFYRSSNLGITWSGMLPTNYAPYALAVKNSNIFASYFNGTTLCAYLAHSTDNGNNWTEITWGAVLFSYIGFSNSRVYVSNIDGGLYCSTNNGSNWYVLESFNHRSSSCITSIGNNVFVASDSGVWLSTNNGDNWVLKDEGFSGHPSVYSLLIFDNYIFASIGSIWRRLLSELISGLENKSSSIPEKFCLYQNYPNPFNPSTIIRYSLPKNGYVVLKIYDILGREMSVLVNENQKASNYETQFSIDRYANHIFSTGIYFYSLFVDGVRVDTKKCLLIK
jgi:hypothetical protein